MISINAVEINVNFYTTDLKKVITDLSKVTYSWHVEKRIIEGKSLFEVNLRGVYWKQEEVDIVMAAVKENRV